MTKSEEHDAQRDRVRASYLQLVPTTAEKHGVYPLRPRPVTPEPPRAA
jgi:hypothetical protein